MMQTPKPSVIFIIRISVFVIPSKETSIDLCRENIEAKASAKEIFLNAISFADVLFRAFIQFIVASVNFVKAYTAIASITII